MTSFDTATLKAVVELEKTVSGTYEYQPGLVAAQIANEYEQRVRLIMTPQAQLYETFFRAFATDGAEIVAYRSAIGTTLKDLELVLAHKARMHPAVRKELDAVLDTPQPAHEQVRLLFAYDGLDEYEEDQDKLRASKRDWVFIHVPDEEGADFHGSAVRVALERVVDYETRPIPLVE